MTDFIKVFSHNSIMIKTESGAVYIDPFKMYDSPKDAAFVLITHDHYDHFSPEDIAKVANSNTILAVPEKMAKKANEAARLVKEIVTVKQTESKKIAGLKIETVPAYNTLKPFHTKSAGWVGYILEVKGQRIYIAGDTDATKEAREVKCDIALVPIGGTYTMDAKKAAELINEMQPKVAIPVHYGSIVGSSKDADKFASLVNSPVKVDIKIGK